ncbi:hypothetical protein F5884DRAFT_897492 [Xylogone sp. PMI_703]|nr:hypothetical protein F5884DRAFT_897492 [Xylogone sp. PMI_703]
MTSSDSSPSLTKILFNHVALPPQLPGKQDDSVSQVECGLINLLHSASRTLRDFTSNDLYNQFDAVCYALRICKALNAGRKLESAALAAEFRKLGRKEFLILHIAEQNAGLLIRRHQDGQEDIIIFEAFEASPLSEKVLSSEGSLKWEFPGSAASIPISEFNNPLFQDELAAFLQQASTESIKQFAAHTHKAGSFAFESRDTTDPSLITQALVALLEVNGSPYPITKLCKRISDDVCWTDGAENPWRRCPMWLVLRIGVERLLCTMLGNEAGRVYYKFLMCVVLSDLLVIALDHLHPEEIMFLKAKLCRRIVKLEVEKERASIPMRGIYESMFTLLEPTFQKATQAATETVELEWSRFKESIRKPIQYLPRYADPKDTYLSLPNSGLYLQQVLSQPLYNFRADHSFTPYQLPVDYISTAAATWQFGNLMNRIFSLSEIEVETEHGAGASVALETDFDYQCIKIAQKIDNYLDAVGDSYDHDPEQKSVMILTVMELWVSMDQCAVQSFNLLNDYNPAFVPEILDVLHLPNFRDMCRLQNIQTYLHNRNAACSSTMTIFDDPTRGCFAERYFNESEDSIEMQELLERIETIAERARKTKEYEWKRLSIEYEDLTMAISKTACVYTSDDFQPLIRIHDDKNCTKCFLQRKAKRINIKVHEHPLPSDLVTRKAVVFEINCPEAFGAYRDTTWRILGTIARSKQVAGLEPRTLLHEYSELKQHIQSTPRHFSLASTTKSFLTTHYKHVYFPVDLENVCLPNGLKLGYYDVPTKVWPSRQAQKPSFAHHCKIAIPDNSPFSILQSAPYLSIDVDGPSSYEIIASQTRCPTGLNVHEFMAYQTLFSGKYRRWPSILVELGSSNLNFSSEAVSLLICRLSSHAGPAFGTNPLRVIHKIFEDDNFCRQLIHQLDVRLDNISSNWRETHCMQMLVTLVLRICSVAPTTTVKDAAFEMLDKLRMICFKWMCLLRREIYGATNAESARTYSRYALWSALLCRKTYAIDAEDGADMSPDAVRLFVVSSITLQENMNGSPDELPLNLRSALIHDNKLVYRIRFALRQLLKARPEIFMSAIGLIWPEPDGSSTRHCKTFFFSYPNEWWIQSNVEEMQGRLPYSIHYHILDGHLLINGQPLGKLPPEHRNSVVLKQLFGDQALLTYPSTMPGMSYMLAIDMYGYQIHIGFRQGSLVVRALKGSSTLELIPPEIFGVLSNADLPGFLIENCVHWMDLNTGIIEIRKQTNIWKSMQSNWLLDVNTRQAQRRTSSLIDPHSMLYKRVARIFEGFEYRPQITVYQPAKGRLKVELRRLELSFSVNERNLLESPELQCEIDPDQDAGTWYGLNSKLVLRDSINQRRRSIIVPMGQIRYKRNGIHVMVRVENDGGYGRFAINDILGRLECPAELRLLYLKAQLHAYTSFAIPDPLTKRTGSEQALHCLRSGYCQPWTPLSPRQSLISISRLTPKREYYPKDAKFMQKISWDPELTSTIQHDGLRGAIETIYRKSDQLSVFASQNTGLASLESAGDPHLLNRSYSRRRKFFRLEPESDGYPETLDTSYIARDRRLLSVERSNVIETTYLIRNWASKMPTMANLAAVLQDWPNIGGYDRIFDKVLLSDRLSTQLALEWGSLVNLCRFSTFKDKYRLMFLFAIMSYRHDINMDIIRTLIAFSVLSELKVLEFPKWPLYVQFRRNQIPHTDYLLQLLKHCCIPYPMDDRQNLEFSLSPKERKKAEAAERAYERQAEDDCKSFAQFLLSQWPSPELSLAGFQRSILVDTRKALDIILPEWVRLCYNLELSKHIDQVQVILDKHRLDNYNGPPLPDVLDRHDVSPIPFLRVEFPTWTDLLSRRGPDMLDSAESRGTELNQICLQQPRGNDTSSMNSSQIEELHDIIDGIAKSQSNVRQQYAHDLKQSLESLKQLKRPPEKYIGSIDSDMLSVEISIAQRAANDQFNQICEALGKGNRRSEWLRMGGLWPCVTTITLLEKLRSISAYNFGSGMKESIVAYAVSVTVLQRLMRMEDADKKNHTRELFEELKNVGHKNWQPLEYTDWLLLEIDANILIRHDQVVVARATICPDSNSNSVLQMNMGQGKTSCIMPMVAAILADTKNLMRLIVPKPLLLQTAQLLQARLGGLLGREVRHVPFSRKTSTNAETIKSFYNIHHEVFKSSSVILALPEHLLSFNLSGRQRMLDERMPEAKLMLKVEAWLQRICRDVLDESDFTLAVRTQLIYPSGSNTVVDGHPHRWNTIESLLKLVEGHLWNLQCEFYQSIEVVPRYQGGFPIVYFLRKDVEDALLTRLVDDICYGRTAILPTRDCLRSDSLMIKKYISEAKVQQSITDRIHEMYADNKVARCNIHLLRGLLVHRILLLTLKKRWNVQYGLHPDRDPLAVPFHAKGVPSEQAEWGHPDVAILFTCLSFYYGGLTLSQLQQSLKHVLKSDDPSREYDRWTHDLRYLPDSLREWNAINADDDAQLNEIWQHARHSMIVIDYFMNNFVFPRYAKQFHMKLQASGWDIPLFSTEPPHSPKSKVITHTSLTTGFSGTNDNRTMLPLNIKQEDLPELSHTNAEVLTYLLQNRSRSYVLAADRYGRHLSELDLLRKMCAMGIRVLIDAGAQILEMDNVNLAATWLTVDHKAQAAVYFDANNKPMVHYRQGHEVPLLASPFAENLDGCLVYLDEAHTRGTDLKMPPNARGALTLGLGQTKDQTVQAAMRLRQLGTSQAVIFFAPPEVHQSILHLRKKTNRDAIDSHDVIRWILEQTCEGIEQLQPLYYSQGSDFCRRMQAAIDNPDFLVDSEQRSAYLGVLKQKEQQTLQQLYQPRTKSKSKFIASELPTSPKLVQFTKELEIRRKAFQDTGNAVHSSALQEVEQEREVAFEVEAIREVQKPVHYSPLSFRGLHKDIVIFVNTGRLAVDSAAYEEWLVAVRRTNLGQKYGIKSDATASKLYVSTEFTRTLSLSSARLRDNFQRQVNWILWSSASNAALIVNPEEVEHLIPLICTAKQPTTHLLTYAAAVTRKMLHFNKLDYFAIPNLPQGWEAPKWLTVELGLFAGRLYFEYNEYSDICLYLGSQEEGGATSGQSFTSKPLTFLQEWLSLKRKGQDFVHTPMGYVCQAKSLTVNHPFFHRVEEDTKVEPLHEEA